MGVGIVFLSYIVFLGIAVAIALPISALVARRIGRKLNQQQRFRLMLGGALLPVFAGMYLIGFLIAMAIFGVATGRDLGFGDSYVATLNNGYVFDAIDVPDYACIYKRGVGDSNHALIDGAIALQQDGDWLAGTIAKEDVFSVGSDRKWTASVWFLLNTRTGSLEKYQTEAELRAAMQSQGITMKLEEAETFFGRYRYRWYDLVVALLLALPGLVALLLAYRYVRRWMRGCIERNAPLPWTEAPPSMPMGWRG